MAHHPDLTVTEIAGQVRSTAVDLVLASQAAARDEPGLAAASTEEMLAEALSTSSSRPPVDAAGRVDIARPVLVKVIAS